MKHAHTHMYTDYTHSYIQKYKQIIITQAHIY